MLKNPWIDKYRRWGFVTIKHFALNICEEALQIKGIRGFARRNNRVEAYFRPYIYWLVKQTKNGL